MKERLVRITRLPLVLVTMWIAFAEIARGPALLGNDLYRGVPPESGAEWQEQLELDDSMEAPSEHTIYMTSLKPSSSADDGRSSSEWSGRIRNLRDDAIEPLFALQLDATSP